MLLRSPDTKLHFTSETLFSVPSCSRREAFATSMCRLLAFCGRLRMLGVLTLPQTSNRTV